MDLKYQTIVTAALISAFIAAGCASNQTAREPDDEPPPPETTLTDVGLVDELADGGEVVYIRHSATDTNEADDDKSDLRDCSGQRNLTREGREQAKEIGEAFDRIDIPVEEGLASPYCRTLQTAELAFGEGDVRTTRDLLSPEYVPASEATEVEDYASAVTDLISTPPEDGTNLVLVGHESVIRTITGESALEGGAIVFHPLGDDEYQVLGTIGPEDWRTLRK